MTFTTEIQPGVEPNPPRASEAFTLNHCMLRVKDPDGYWIEIVEPGGLKNLGR